MLQQETEQLSMPPVACFGMAATLLGGYTNNPELASRALFHGGWGEHGAKGGINALQNSEREKLGIVSKEVNCCIILDLEQVEIICIL